MTTDEQCLTRLDEIRQLLDEAGADPAYTRNYFQSGGGVCERVVGGRCKRHRPCAPPLPACKMCAEEFGESVAELRAQMARAEAEGARLLREYKRLKTEGALPSHQRVELQHEMLHSKKAHLDLKGQLLGVLEHDPVDAQAWHEQVSALLTERIALWERLKLGRAREPCSLGSPRAPA
jgi:hypothetical protein